MRRLSSVLGITLVCAAALLGSGPTNATAPQAQSSQRYDDVPASSARFSTLGSPWNHTNITYFFANGTADITGTDEQQAVRDAFVLWSASSTLTFTEVFDAGSADIVLSWATGNHGDGANNAFDGINGVLAHAFSPGGGIGGDAHFDDAETWTTAVRPSGGQPMDLVTIAAHELGHSIGLGHSNHGDALMAPFYNGSHRFLSEDDIDGVQALYGAAIACTPSGPIDLCSSPNPQKKKKPVTLTAAAASDPGLFSITILEGSTVLASCDTGTSCSTTVTRKKVGTRTFVARISASDGTNTQDESAPETVTWVKKL